MSSYRPPRLAVTMGDPAGIGPEICLHLLNDASLAGVCIPIVFGDAGVLQRVADKLKISFTAPVVAEPAAATGPAVLDLHCVEAAAVVPGRVDARCGDAAFRYVIAAIEAGLAGKIDAVATGPLNKEAMHAAGHKYPGHTEIFAERMQAARSCMMLTSPELTCSFATVHVGYHEVPGLLSVRRIQDVIELTAEAMQRIRSRPPSLVVCGLNPHAGENGLFGQREEERFIVPAIAAVRAQGLQVEGPLPPDTAFLPRRRRSTDAFICMYHDQGHIPLKALAFDSAINTTLGLPVIRTSVDHGTAFDIAWQGRASASSLGEAVRLAARLCQPRPMIVVIADDLSGAAELAGAATRHGLSAEVQTTFSPGTDADVVCVDTDSRSLAPADAARRVAAATHLIVAARPAWIFKKCDSVLRGPVLAEARAAAKTAGKQRILLVPANPSRGRTISGGIYRIAGLPLDETPFATDPTHPPRTADVKKLLGGDLADVIVPDTATAREIQLQTDAVDDRTLPVGAVDFFVALLAARTPKGSPRKPSPVAPGKKLLVCGSAAAWARRHAEAIAAGIPVFSLPHDPSASIGALQAGNAALLGIGAGPAVREVPAGELLRRLAEAVAGVVREVPVKYLLLEGGATAAAAIGSLGWTRLRAEQVADPGVGVLRPVEARTPLVVVKPGSYPWPAEFWP